jgi:bacillithiol biosynthesis cysteine-adding enzyme BshC
MPKDRIRYQESGYFAPLINDYLDQKPELNALYDRFPSLGNFEAQLNVKESHFPIHNRTVLVKALEKQYQKSAVSEATQNNIQALARATTFTVTTGHQLNLFTGPLYFLYKIISTINLCDQLKKTYPHYHFVPIYWMATEDHDFEEINYFQFKKIKIKWLTESHGPVGRLSTEGLEDVYKVFADQLGPGENATALKALFENSYLKHDNLADATRYLANQLFGNHGLVILDGDDAELKQLFQPFVKKELIEQTSVEQVSKTNEVLQQKYAIQVNPREINLFYIEDQLRERIIWENERFKVNNTQLSFTEQEILTLLDTNPEKFSPNVILRPLYQEVILPNLCYIGGGGELAYWLQLKANFEAFNVPFPMLLLRNSAVLASPKQVEKADKLDLDWSDLFAKPQDLFNRKTAEYSKLNLDFTQQKEALKLQFNALKEIAEQTDKSFANAVKAQESKQLKGLENLEKRLLKAEKRSYSEKLERILLLQNELFPNESLQERKANFSEFYLEHGTALIDKIKSELDPLDTLFTIITL